MFGLPAYVGAISIAGTTGPALPPGAALTEVVETAGRAEGLRRQPRPERRSCSPPGQVRVHSSPTTVAIRRSWKQPPWLPIVAVGAMIASAPADAHSASVGQRCQARTRCVYFRGPIRSAFAGVAFVISMFLGHMPALFALPAGLGDIAVGVAEPVLARRINAGRRRRPAIWFNVLGIVDLVTAMTLGGLTAYGIVHVSPVNSLSQLPMALVPTVGVPMVFVLHILALRQLRRSPERQTASELRGIETQWRTANETVSG